MSRTSLILREAQRAVSKGGPGIGRGLAAYLYILRCADGSYYVGTTRGSLEERFAALPALSRRNRVQAPAHLSRRAPMERSSG